MLFIMFQRLDDDQMDSMMNLLHIHASGRYLGFHEEL